MRITLLLISIFFSFHLKAQVYDSTKTCSIYELGEVTIVKKGTLNSITEETSFLLNKTNVSSSISLLPSVILSNTGGRNEAAVFVRGFDIRSVPVFIDGIPVSVSYDGYVDLGRFVTFDISKIDVSKGFSSISYGANTLGGAINIVSSKPKHKIEIKSFNGYSSGNKISSGISVGSRVGKIYAQGSFFYEEQQFMSMSKKFNPIEIIGTENGGKRDNSYYKDRKISLKIGYIPNNTDEYSFNYINSHAEKGNPPYAGNDENIRERFWQWPNWDKESFYFISKKKISQLGYFKIRAFYDKFYNLLESYDDNSYVTQNKPYTFSSVYDDYSLGTNFDFNFNQIKGNYLKISGHLKNDNHTEYNIGEPERNFTDNTFSLGIENYYKIKKVTFTGNLSFNTRNAITAEDYVNNEIINFPKFSSNSINYGLRILYSLTDKSEITISAAHKTRFPTMKDRYSYKLGRAIPNPKLQSENAENFEINYSTNINNKFTLKPAIFYSYIKNAIISVDDIEPSISQMQNTGLAEFYGIELPINVLFSPKFSFSANYAFIRRKNISSPNVKFTDVPEHSFNTYLNYLPLKKLSFVFGGEYNSDRYSSSYGTVAKKFYTMFFSSTFKINKYLSFTAGINNILDENYCLMEGYPEAGRTFYINLLFKLNKNKIRNDK